MAIDVPEELAPRGPAGRVPPRPPHSLRRTSTFDSTFPDGIHGHMILVGRARDLYTDEMGVGHVIAEAKVDIIVSGRKISSIRTTPDLPSLNQLVGFGSGSGFRAQLREVMPDEVANASLVHLLLDDIPGAALVSRYAFTRWLGPGRYLAESSPASPPRSMTGVCTGFQAGSSGLNPDGTSRWNHRIRDVEDIDATTDPLAWHDVLDMTGEISSRRSRLTDVTVSGGEVKAYGFFQDSSTTHSGGRQAVHEYTVEATADLASETLTELLPVARVLPYRECPLAVAQVGAVIGVRISELRTEVPERLKLTSGCTHLNDVIRSLGDVATLAECMPRP